jgi:cation diffusion facilitator CzcD-associated flavoprotein CzcO
VARHFKPNYNPWDQRVCAAPDGDLFQAISKGRVSIVTDSIERFVPDGIRLRSGETLPADVVVTATGLKVLPLGGIRLSLDGRTVDLAESMVYRGAMLSGIPNLVLTFGYTNASWTLRADLIAAYVCRLLGHLDRHGYQYAVPVRDPSVGEMPFIDFNSGYVLRALEGLPKQGDRFPWRVHQTYLRDLGVTRYSRLTDPALRFGRATDLTHA